MAFASKKSIASWLVDNVQVNDVNKPLAALDRLGIHTMEHLMQLQDEHISHITLKKYERLRFLKAFAKLKRSYQRHEGRKERDRLRKKAQRIDVKNRKLGDPGFAKAERERERIQKREYRKKKRANVDIRILTYAAIDAMIPTCSGESDDTEEPCSSTTEGVLSDNDNQPAVDIERDDTEEEDCSYEILHVADMEDLVVDVKFERGNSSIDGEDSVASTSNIRGEIQNTRLNDKNKVILDTVGGAADEKARVSGTADTRGKNKLKLKGKNRSVIKKTGPHDVVIHDQGDCETRMSTRNRQFANTNGVQSPDRGGGHGIPQVKTNLGNITNSTDQVFQSVQDASDMSTISGSSVVKDVMSEMTGHPVIIPPNTQLKSVENNYGSLPVIDVVIFQDQRHFPESTGKGSIASSESIGSFSETCASQGISTSGSHESASVHLTEFTQRAACVSESDKPLDLSRPR